MKILRTLLMVVSLTALAWVARPASAQDFRKSTVQSSQRWLEQLYTKVAPATVVVSNRSGDGGSGTGFVVHPDGWIVTAAHVVDRANHDPKTGALRTRILFGKPNTAGQVKPLLKAVHARVYRFWPNKDLALLKVEEMPAGFDRLPFIPLAPRIRTGSTCAAIGNVRGGMLWSIRTGHVAALGSLPEDETVNAIDLFDGRPIQRGERPDLFKGKVVCAACPVSQGDSGGPLVNESGQLIGVTIRIPKLGKMLIRGLGYFVHCDEVRSLIKDLADLPDSPQPYIPKPLSAKFLLQSFQGFYNTESHDLDGDGHKDTLLLRHSADKTIDGVFVDLKHAIPEVLQVSSESLKVHFVRIDDGLKMRPRRTFLDTDGDGSFDVIICENVNGGRPTETVILRRKSDKWHVEASNERFTADSMLFTEPQMQVRFANIMSGLQGLQPRPPVLKFRK